MAQTVAKGDFIELDYTGKMIDGTVFDTTNKDVAQENKIQIQKELKPIVICVGEKQLLAGLDEEVIGKEVGKEYSATFGPEKAFGKRDVKKIKIIPRSTFSEHKVQPHPGLQINVDGEVGVVSRVSGGRIIVNFNHPLAGKEVTYEFTVKRVLSDDKEKVENYLTSVLRIPVQMMKVDVKETKANVELSFALPEQITSELAKNIVRLTPLKEVTFTQKKQEAKPKE